jgi:hypothetical protein
VNAWDAIRMFIDRQNAHAVATRIVKLDEVARKDVAERLPEYLKVLRSGREPWEGLNDYAEVLRAAGAGVLPGAAAVTSWLSRREFTSRWGGPYGDTDRIMAILATRPPEWRADLARRLVPKIRTAEDRDLDLTLALLRATGIEIPIHDPLVVGWVSTGRLPVPHEDPLFDTLLPRVFDAQGVGRALQWEGPTGSFLGSLRALAAEDGAKRLTLLQGCVNRFLRGGSATELRFFVRLHEALDPAPHEIEPRARDYLRLLPTAPGPIAELALRHLRTLDGLDPLDLVEGLESVLFRSERKLVRTGLTWMDQLVRLSPSLAESIAGALVPVFASDSVELQERAVTLAIKHADRMGDEGHATIRDALDVLPYDLRLRAFAVFGGEEPAEPDLPPAFVPPALPLPEPPQRMPDPIVSVAEIMPMMRGSDDWMAWEQLLAGFVALVYRDREGTAAALKPSMTGNHDYLYRDDEDRDHYQDELNHWNRVEHWLLRAMCSLTGKAPAHDAWKRRLPDAHYLSPPYLLLLHRAAEIQMAVEENAVPPLLLSTPTFTTGHLDAAELVARLEILEAAGAKPLAADLQQALLRLPREHEEEAAERAGRLSSPAGRLVAQWLAGNPLADPVVEIRSSNYRGEVRPWLDDDESDDLHTVTLKPSLHAPATGFPLIDLMFRKPPGYHKGIHLSWWPSLFPSHREVAAAYLLPELFNGDWHGPTVRPDHLRQLARLDGPPGAAVSLVLGRMLGNPGTPEAVDILLTMTGRGDLLAAELGRQAALLVKRNQIKLVHLTAALESASLRGAHEEVWTAIAAALPLLVPIPGRKPHHGLAAFVALGATTAAWCHARGAIPELEAVAARKGSSGVLREARRLHGLLTAEEG